MVDEDYNPMYDAINETTGFTSRTEIEEKGTSQPIRDRYNNIISKLHDSIGYSEPKEEVLP